MKVMLDARIVAINVPRFDAVEELRASEVVVVMIGNELMAVGP